MKKMTRIKHCLLVIEVREKTSVHLAFGTLVHQPLF